MQITVWISELLLKFNSMWRWALVGITTAVIDYFLFLFLYSIIESVLFANFFSGLVSLSFNYIMHYFWSFKSASDHKNSGTRYLINLVVVWSLGTLFLKILITSGIDPRIAKVIPVLIIAPASYLSLNFFVFKKGNRLNK
jgi:putative flippase GtrA